MKSVAEPFL